MAPLPPRPTRDRTDDDASSSTEKEDASKIEGRGGRATPSAARLQPLLEYKTRLRRAEEELKDIISRLQQQQQQRMMMEDENEKVLGFSG